MLSLNPQSHMNLIMMMALAGAPIEGSIKRSASPCARIRKGRAARIKRLKEKLARKNQRRMK